MCQTWRVLKQTEMYLTFKKNKHSTTENDLKCFDISETTFFAPLADGRWIQAVCFSTGCPRMFYTQKCKILRIFITIKTIEFGILIYLSDRAVLLAFWRILNQGNQPNETENTWHYVKRVIFCILIEMGKEGFMSFSA